MNITFTIIITAFAVVAILIGVVQVLCKNLKETKEHLKMAEEELEKAHKNVVFLLNHAKELEQIRASEKEIEQKIEGAKTDEEIYSIVNSIIDANNDRMPDD